MPAFAGISLILEEGLRQTLRLQSRRAADLPVCQLAFLGAHCWSCRLAGFLLGSALRLALGLLLGFFLGPSFGFLFGFSLAFFLASLSLRLTLCSLFLCCLSLLAAFALRSFLTALLFGSHHFLRVGYPALSIYNKS